MKVTKIGGAVLLLICVMLAGLAGCSSGEEITEPETANATVYRGDLTSFITAAGNLALSMTEDVIVDLFYQQGTISEVLVEVGDSVAAGQILARIDADEWEEQLDSLESALTTARRNLNTQERALTTAERQVKIKELACDTAEISLAAAEYALEDIEEVKKVQDKIDSVNYRLDYIDSMLVYTDSADYGGWLNHRNNELERLAELQQEKNSILAGTNITISDTAALEIQRRQLNIETAIINLETANDGVAEALLNLEYAEADIENASKSISSLTKTLEEARSKSPDLIAPFDGFISTVNVKGGDEVIRGKVAVSVADPDEFQADIYVNETEILDVQIGTPATVVADAITGMTFPASVTHISPTATISSGVVNYTVRVELSNLEEMLAKFEIPESNVSPEGMEIPEGSEIPSGSSFKPSSDDTGNVPGGIGTADYDLRDGMSVTVNLITMSETNVLLVPYTSVTTIGGQSFVDVVLENGETEQRQVTTGSTNYSFTSITSGLSEGETIIVPTGIISSGTSQLMPGSFGGPGRMSEVRVEEFHD